MKKLFLIPLMTLLCCVMAWGATITVGESGQYATLAEAFAAAEVGDVVQLVSGLDLGTTGFTFNKEVTVDFHGNTITASANWKMEVKDATVTFTDNSVAGNGGINVNGKGALDIYSTAVINGGTFTAVANTLYVEDGQSLTINGGTIRATTESGVAVFAGSGSSLTVNDGLLEALSYTLYTWGVGTATVSGGTIRATEDKGQAVVHGGGGSLTVEGGSIEGPFEGFGIFVFTEGTTLNITGGTINSAGYAISGNGTSGYGGTTINIDGGTIGNATTEIGIYHPQAGTLNITGGTITGQTGIGIKGGTLNISGGTIHAVGNNGGRVEGYNNGINSSFAAVQIESNPGYAGNMNITVSDNATLISDSWYAFYEYLSNPESATKVNSIAVSGGNFQGGILLSQDLNAKGGFVSGGKWSVDVTANVVKGKVANPIDEDPYFFEVGDPTLATAEIVNDPSKNAVLTNEDGETYAGSYTSETVGDDAEVKTSTATNQVVVSENTDVVVDKTDENNSTIVEVKKVTVEGDAQLSVKEGATLMVGTGSVLLDENTTTGGLTVEAGAALVVDGLVYGSTEDNFVIKGEEDKSGIVLFSPETEFIREDHPKATYRFKSKSFKDGSKWVYQRFGMPSVDGNVTVKEADGTPSTVRSFICTWDYATDDWNSWAELDKTNGLVYTDAVPFQCYQLGSDNIKDAPVTYDFIVELMGNANAPLNFKAGWNPYANSYTAPIDIKEFLTDVIANNGSDILATIYLYKDLGNDTYTWQGINLSNVGKTYRVRENGAMVKKTYDASIEPMQAFIMKLSSGDDATTDINYLNNVYNPAMGIDRPASAPARSRASYNEMQIGAYNDMYWDNISVMEGEQFSAAEDNGYDAPKYDHNRGLSLYVINGEQHMERVATDNADGLFIGINAPVAGTYTLDFSGIVGMNYSIMDMTNNTIVTIEEDGQFNFYAEAGQNDHRFQLVAPARVPTAVENVGAKADVKGVYTITGQYLGEDINALPKGVYIINGAKVVK